MPEDTDEVLVKMIEDLQQQVDDLTARIETMEAEDIKEQVDERINEIHDTHNTQMQSVLDGHKKTITGIRDEIKSILHES